MQCIVDVMLAWVDLRWLVLCVNLAWPREGQIAGKPFPSVSVMVFLEGIIIWSSRLRKEILPMCISIIQSLEGLKRKKSNSLSSFWAGKFVFSCPWTSELLVLGSLYFWTLIMSLWFSGLLEISSYTTGCMVLSDFNWIILASYLVLTACTCQFMGLLGLH